jgi:hypothetical protein
VRRFALPIIVLIVLAVAFILLIDPAGWFKHKQKEDVDAGLPVLCNLEADDINSIEFTKPDGVTVRLERDGDKWKLIGDGVTYRAKQDRIDKFLEDIPGLKAASLATDNPDKYETFEVDDAKATMLTISGKDESTAVKLIVGKAAPGYTSAFVRQDGGKEVYTTSRNVRALLAYAFDDYRTKKPWEFDQMAATEIRIRPLEGEGDYKVYKREDGVWKTADGANANQNALTELAEKLSGLSINSFAGEMGNTEDVEKAGMTGVEPQLVISTSDGSYSLTIGGSDEALRYIADQDGHLYKVGSASLKFYTELDQATLDIAPPEPEATASAGDAAPPLSGADSGAATSDTGPGSK